MEISENRKAVVNGADLPRQLLAVRAPLPLQQILEITHPQERHILASTRLFDRPLLAPVPARR